MEAEESEKLLMKSDTLRQELKFWERDFAAANDGRKAGRDDIKQHPTIAQKYKDYNRARDILSGKAASQAPSSPPKKASRKRRQETAAAETPSKRLQIAKTPSKRILHPAIVDPYDSPSLVRTLFTPPSNRVIGPTPQKDGQVLGLFDLLSEQDGSSPAKGQVRIIEPGAAPQGTPRKLDCQVKEDNSGTIRHSRTPSSSGKRFMLDHFATPLKKRHPNELGGKTPSSISKLKFSTPSFLRRNSQRTLMPPIQKTENDLTISPQIIRIPKKPLVRGLSSMLASLRKMEEDAADDDLDALREMENEYLGITKSKPVTMECKSEKVPVEDSQLLPTLLGGFDDEAMYDSEPEDIKNPQLGRDGQPLKVWKKKGQKRTTRRVVMKPVRSKPKSQPRAGPRTSTRESSPEYPPQLKNNLNDDKVEDDKAVPETQLLPSLDYSLTANDEGGNFDSESASEYTASEGGTRYRRPNQEKKRKSKGSKGGHDGEGKIKEGSRKVKATAHMNLKRLKLKNSGAKGGPGHGSRFRRRK